MQISTTMTKNLRNMYAAQKFMAKQQVCFFLTCLMQFSSRLGPVLLNETSICSHTGQNVALSSKQMKLHECAIAHLESEIRVPLMYICILFGLPRYVITDYIGGSSQRITLMNITL